MKSIGLSIVVFLCVSCGSQSKVGSAPATDEWAFTRLSFGESGGVTGEQKIYLIENSGRLISIGEKGEIAVIDTIGPRERLRIDSLSRELWSLEEVRTSPGNLNRRVSIKRKNDEKSFIWGQPGPEVPRLLESFHGYLMGLAQK